MDTTKETPKKITRRLPGKKVVLIILVLVLAAGAAGAYYYRQRPESKKADTQQTDSNLANPDEVRARYAQTKEQLEELGDSNPASVKFGLYSLAAFDGASLDDPAAKDYAQKALELDPDDKAVQAAQPELARFLEILREIAKGDYHSAKAFVKQADE